MNSAQLAHTGVLSLIAQAGLVAKFVLILLLGASMICWAIILTKWKTLKIANRQNEKFIETFWNGKTIDEIASKSENYSLSPVATVFQQGVKELRRLSSTDSVVSSNSDKVNNIHRALVRASSSEISTLEKHVSWLATTASAAPFVGLFGTVWGIMNAFQNIGASGAANLAIVAPGISEALITTATGIAAAIPAVIAYNYFVGQIKRIAVDIDCFSQDFINIIQRSLIGGKKGN